MERFGLLDEVDLLREDFQLAPATAGAWSWMFWLKFLRRLPRRNFRTHLARWSSQTRPVTRIVEDALAASAGSDAYASPLDHAWAELRQARGISVRRDRNGQLRTVILDHYNPQDLQAYRQALEAGEERSPVPCRTLCVYGDWDLDLLIDTVRTRSTPPRYTHLLHPMAEVHGYAHGGAVAWLLIEFDGEELVRCTQL